MYSVCDFMDCYTVLELVICRTVTDSNVTHEVMVKLQ